MMRRAIVAIIAAVGACSPAPAMAADASGAGGIDIAAHVARAEIRQGEDVWLTVSVANRTETQQHCWAPVLQTGPEGLGLEVTVMRGERDVVPLSRATINCSGLGARSMPLAPAEAVVTRVRAPGGSFSEPGMYPVVVSALGREP